MTPSSTGGESFRLRNGNGAQRRCDGKVEETGAANAGQDCDETEIEISVAGSGCARRQYNAPSVDRPFEFSAASSDHPQVRELGPYIANLVQLGSTPRRHY
jgi:hypothetical protein